MNRHRCECSTCTERGDEIERLQDAKRAALKLADERAIEANGLRAALKKILAANDSFRRTMPERWEPDLLQDACDEARLLLSEENSK
jgi:hypothetical protein